MKNEISIEAQIAELQRKLLVELKSFRPDHAAVFRLREQIHALKPDALLYWGFSGGEARAQFERKLERRRRGPDGLLGSSDR